LLGATGLPSPEYEGVLERVEHQPVPVPVVVDGERAWLPAIHVKGTFEGVTGDVNAEFWFLDDPQNPLTLRGMIGPVRLVAVRIDSPKGIERARLERALSSDERIDLPGVYFEFASARLRTESDAAIAEVASVLRSHPDWKVRLEGHTDSVGSAEANLELSRARAGAVRQAVIDRLGGGADRLEAIGFGLTRPRESNDTPEGRARNRRVEIVRVR
jgi:outer membrane protein OmpA-like peptidoglycan-associated protein